MKLSETLKEDIDSLLLYLLENNYFSYTSESPENEVKALKMCTYLNLIRLRTEKTGNTYELVEKGVFVINEGGIENYLKNINAEKDLDNAIKVLTNKRLKNGIYYDAFFVVIGALIGLSPTLLDNEPKNLKEEIQKLKIKSEKTLINDNFQRQLHHKNTLILSLKKQLDSLSKVRLKK